MIYPVVASGFHLSQFCCASVFLAGGYFIWFKKLFCQIFWVLKSESVTCRIYTTCEMFGVVRYCSSFTKWEIQIWIRMILFPTLCYLYSTENVGSFYGSMFRLFSAVLSEFVVTHLPYVLELFSIEELPHCCSDS